MYRTQSIPKEPIVHLDYELSFWQKYFGIKTVTILRISDNLKFKPIKKWEMKDGVYFHQKNGRAAKSRIKIYYTTTGKYVVETCAFVQWKNSAEELMKAAESWKEEGFAIYCNSVEEFQDFIRTEILKEQSHNKDFWI